ncbi:MAG: Tetratricopeptide 2 repeat protein [Deltaproteobacteria bacterium]|nr:Tetratricopeptide 2 repeat protein [Deltaproteobacteria bacterium]
MGELLTFTRALGPNPGRKAMLRGTPATVWYDRGCALEAADPSSEAAIAAYGRALAGRPDLPDAHNNLGRILHERGELPAAESHYRLALCLDRTVGLYWFNLGVAVEDQGRVAEAIAAYEHALSLDPGLADAHFNLARIYEVIGRGSNNELVLRRAVRHLVRYRELAVG